MGGLFTTFRSFLFHRAVPMPAKRHGFSANRCALTFCSDFLNPRSIWTGLSIER